MEKRIIIVRHGERLDFVDNTWAQTAENPYDPPLTSLGIQQAAETGAFLAHKQNIPHVKAVYCSPFLRTVQTANEIAKAYDVPLRVESGLAEWIENFKELPVDKYKNGKGHSAMFPNIDMSYEPKLIPKMPENREQAMERCQRYVKMVAHSLQSNPDPETVILVTHGAPSEFMSLNFFAPTTKIKFITFCCITEVQYHAAEGRWLMLRLAEDSHLSIKESDRSYS